jgi:hypothetical protein
LIIGFALSVGLNVFQFYTMEHVEQMYFNQCGSSIIAIRESELNKMFDQLEEGSEK